MRPLSQNRYIYVENNPVNYVDPSGLFTIGLGGNLSAAFIGRVGVTGMAVIDGHGNVGILIAPAIGGGTPSIGGSATLTITTANEITDLRKGGFEAGLSAQATPLPIAPGLGIEGCVGDRYKGVTLFANYEVKPWAEGHGEYAYTFIVPVYGSKADELREWIMEQANIMLNKLSEEVKYKIFKQLGLDKQIIDMNGSSRCN